jgi:hypothetical protein
MVEVGKAASQRQKFWLRQLLSKESQFKRFHILGLSGVVLL